jgi:hypothetical protein
MTTTITRYDVAELLNEAAEWRLLGLMFDCPRGDWHAQVSALSAEVHSEKLRSIAMAALEEASEGIYHTAFGPGGPAAPREVSHRQSDLAGQYLAELMGAYAAFAYIPQPDNPPDHIATEVDFVAYLRLKQAFAAARNERDQADVVADAIMNFVDNHLAVTAVPLAGLLTTSSISYLSEAATALSDRVSRYRTAVKSPTSGRTWNDALPIYESDDCCESWD